MRSILVALSHSQTVGMLAAASLSAPRGGVFLWRFKRHRFCSRINLGWHLVRAASDSRVAGDSAGGVVVVHSPHHALSISPKRSPAGGDLPETLS